MRIAILLSLCIAAFGAEPEKSPVQAFLDDEVALAKELREADIAAFAIPDLDNDNYHLFLIDDKGQEAVAALGPGMVKGESHTEAEGICVALFKTILESGLNLPSNSPRVEFISKPHFVGAFCAIGDANARRLAERMVDVLDGIDAGLPVVDPAKPDAAVWKPHLDAIECKKRHHDLVFGSGRALEPMQWYEKLKELQAEWQTRRAVLVALFSEKSIAYDKTWCARTFKALDGIAEIKVEVDEGK